MKKSLLNTKDKRLQEIKSTLSGFSEETVFVLTSHLLVEKYIDEIIEKSFKNGKKITHNRFTFLEKCKILESIGILTANGFPLLVELNSLRNKFGHKLNYKICKKDLNKFIPYLKNDFRKKLPINDASASNFEIFGLITYYILGLISGTIDATLKMKINLSTDIKKK